MQEPRHVDHPRVVGIRRFKDVERRDLVVGKGVPQVHRADCQLDTLSGKIVKAAGFIRQTVERPRLKTQTTHRRIDKMTAPGVGHFIIKPPAPLRPFELIRAKGPGALFSGYFPSFIKLNQVDMDRNVLDSLSLPGLAPVKAKIIVEMHHGCVLLNRAGVLLFVRELPRYWITVLRWNRVRSNENMNLANQPFS